MSQDDLEELRARLCAEATEAADLTALESLRVQALGKKGEITQLV